MNYKFEKEDFDIKHLESISSFAGRKRYLASHFTELGKGSSRAVFDLGNGDVIKIATNAKGLAQNVTESDAAMAALYPDELNPPKDSDEDGKWVVSKKLEKVSKRDIADYFGTRTWKEFSLFMKQISNYQVRPHENGYPDLPDVIDGVDISRLEDLSRMCMDTDLIAGDFARDSSWGLDKETGRVMILDHGLNWSTLKEMYQKPAPSYGYGI